MKLYNILFYYSYVLALRSKSNRDSPLFFAIPIVTVCFMFHIFSIFLFLEGMGIIGRSIIFSKENKLIGALFFVSVVAIYYLLNKRYKKIYSLYNNRKNQPPKTSMAILIVVFYYLISFGILLVSALYKNRDWIFRD